VWKDTRHTTVDDGQYTAWVYETHHATVDDDLYTECTLGGWATYVSSFLNLLFGSTSRLDDSADFHVLYVKRRLLRRRSAC
jgi:hypothetical protein